jgi:hypothetical protein
VILALRIVGIETNARVIDICGVFDSFQPCRYHNDSSLTNLNYEQSAQDNYRRAKSNPGSQLE